MPNDIIGFPGEVMSYRDSFIAPHADEIIVNYLNTVGFRGYSVDVVTGGFVDLIFTHQGSNVIELDRRIRTHAGVDVVVLINARAFTLRLPAGASKKGVSLMVYPEVLIDRYGLAIDAMPDHVKAALLGRSREPLTLKLSLTARSRVSLFDIYNTDMSGALLSKFIHAKAAALLCDLVHAWNGAYRAGDRGTLSDASRQEQAVEAAAYLYRSRLAQAPSVDAVAALVGLNRNQLNEGFKSAYGLSPGEYGRIQVLEWAREQLTERHRSIKAVARLCGYANAGAFSRAYRGAFGEPPFRQP